MNKFFFPTTLMAILAVAMVFAVAPVDSAQTLHLPTITGNQISGDSVGSTQVAGANAAATNFAIDTNASAALSSGATGQYTTTVVSQAIVICAWEGTEAGGAIADGIITLTGTNLGTVIGAVEHNIDDILTGDFFQGTAIWTVTDIAVGATDFTCTIAGGTAVDGDITNHTITAIIVPQ